jgi:hypothetical protein
LSCNFSKTWVVWSINEAIKYFAFRSILRAHRQLALFLQFHHSSRRQLVLDSVFYKLRLYNCFHFDGWRPNACSRILPFCLRFNHHSFGFQVFFFHLLSMQQFLELTSFEVYHLLCYCHVCLLNKDLVK